MTIPEVPRLILIATDDPTRRTHQLTWSRFRRRHQAVAKHAHAARRARPALSTSEPPLQIRDHPLLDLTDTRWRTIRALLPADTGRGRPRHDDRRILEAVLWVIRTGAGWSHLPATFPPAATVRGRHRHWQENGTWAAILTVLKPTKQQRPS